VIVSSEPNKSRRKTLPGDKRAALVTVLVCFGFFQYQTWIGLYKTPLGLLVLVAVEVAIGALGLAWIRREQRGAKAGKQPKG
jgi:hypothetical protein